MRTGTIFSPGKLLLTSEYFVLDGALALAVPTQLGQELSFSEKNDRESEVIWEAFHVGKPWLHLKLNYRNWRILETNLPERADFICKVLQNVQDLSSAKFQNEDSYHFKTNLQFPADYGLGSSSTLMNNLAEWAGVDAFQLNQLSLGGSGYDIAVAKEKSAILYQIHNNKKKVENIHFQPVFKDELIFIHLNQKQDSREGINLYRGKTKSEDLIKKISDLTVKVLQTDSLEEFSKLMTFHEMIIADFLELETAKEKFFQDCPVFIKSLGAWGGDFVMSSKFMGYKEYFGKKNFSDIFEWNDLIS